MDENYEPLRKALQKLGDAALRFVEADRGPSLSNSDAIQGGELDPTQFSNLLKNQFGVALTPRELGALVVLFDRDRSGTVSTAEFFSMFHKVCATSTPRQRAPARWP